ncbi:unnamed protein product [Cuscuta campestris]|uniref:Uncharacterized protein n=1 Tax=Cuscuta campestris TaxID=132261 RepID=A0A484MSE0_9ASTE|nr:unnamed protein product [Cuscuta campestris]
MPLKGSYYFTWSSRQCQEIRIHSRIDWVFCNAEWMIRFSTKVLVKDGLSDRSYPSLFLLLLKLCTKVIEASGFVTRAKLMILLLRLLRTFGIRRSKVGPCFNFAKILRLYLRLFVMDLR